MGCTMSKETKKRHASEEEEGEQQAGPRKVQKMNRGQTATKKKKPGKAAEKKKERKGKGKEKAFEDEVAQAEEELILTAREMCAILNTPLRPRPAPMASREETYGLY